MHRPNPLTPFNLYSVRCLTYVIAVQACLWALELVAAESDTCSADLPDTCSGEPQKGKILGYVTPWSVLLLRIYLDYTQLPPFQVHDIQMPSPCSEDMQAHAGMEGGMMWPSSTRTS